MFGFTGAGMSKIRHMQNGGKRGRHSIDRWDQQSTNTPFILPHVMVVHRHGNRFTLTMRFLDMDANVL